MWVGPGPGVKLVLAARRRRPSSSRSSAVTGGSRESVTGLMSGGSGGLFCAWEISGSEASNSKGNRILISNLLRATTKSKQVAGAKRLEFSNRTLIIAQLLIAGGVAAPVLTVARTGLYSKT